MLYELIASKTASADPRAFRGGIDIASETGSIQVDEGEVHPGMTLETENGIVHITPKRTIPCADSLEPLKEEGVIQDYRYIEQESATLLVVEF